MTGDWRQRRQELATRETVGRERALAAAARVEHFLGTTSDQKEATRRLAELATVCNLVTPARVCPQLPEGTGVAFSQYLVNIASDTYPQQGKLALLKPALIQIGQAAGVKPDPALCRRTDSGLDARYYSFQAVGYLTQFDGTVIPLQAHKEYDLRPDSPMVLALTQECIDKAVEDFEDALAAKKDPKDRKLLGCRTRRDAEEVGMDHAEARVRSMQLHAMAQCDSKAFLRMLRTIGIRQAYTAEELALPFVAARLVYTARFSDPEMQREANRRTIDQFTGGRAGVYGTPATAPAVIDVRRSSVTVAPPEPIDDDPPDDEPQGPQDAPEAPTTQEPGPEAPAQPAAPSPPSAGEFDAAESRKVDAEQARPAATTLPPAADAPPMAWKGKPFQIPAGQGKGPVNVADCDDAKQLAYWRDRMTKELDEGKVEKKFEPYQIAKLTAIEYQITRCVPF